MHDHAVIRMQVLHCVCVRVCVCVNFMQRHIEYLQDNRMFYYVPTTAIYNGVNSDVNYVLPRYDLF